MHDEDGNWIDDDGGWVNDDVDLTIIPYDLTGDDPTYPYPYTGGDYGFDPDVWNNLTDAEQIELARLMDLPDAEFNAEAAAYNAVKSAGQAVWNTAGKIFDTALSAGSSYANTRLTAGQNTANAYIAAKTKTGAPVVAQKSNSSGFALLAVAAAVGWLVYDNR